MQLKDRVVVTGGASGIGLAMGRCFVAEQIVEAIAEERFLILTHNFVQTQLQRKVEDPEHWLRGMRRLHGQAA